MNSVTILKIHGLTVSTAAEEGKPPEAKISFKAFVTPQFLADIIAMEGSGSVAVMIYQQQMEFADLKVLPEAEESTPKRKQKAGADVPF